MSTCSNANAGRQKKRLVPNKPLFSCLFSHYEVVQPDTSAHDRLPFHRHISPPLEKGSGRNRHLRREGCGTTAAGITFGLVGEKITIRDYIRNADKEATVVAYKRFALEA